MKVALLFYGQPRFLDNPHPAESHFEHILNKYDTDVYCHTWWKKGLDYFDSSDWVNEKCHTSMNPIDIIKKIYNPLKFEFENPRNFTFNVSANKKIRLKFNEFPWSDKTLSNVNSHLYSLEKSLKLVKDYGQYDFFIISRLDNFIHNFPDLNDLNENKFYLSDHHPRFPDLMYIFGKKFIESQKIYSRIDLLTEKYFDNFWEPSAECYKYFNFIDLFDENDKTPIHLPIRVVRDDVGYGDIDNLPRVYLKKICHLKSLKKQKLTFLIRRMTRMWK